MNDTLIILLIIIAVVMYLAVTGVCIYALILYRKNKKYIEAANLAAQYKDKIYEQISDNKNNSADDFIKLSEMKEKDKILGFLFSIWRKNRKK